MSSPAKVEEIPEAQPSLDKKLTGKKDGLDHRPAPIRTSVPTLEKTSILKKALDPRSPLSRNSAPLPGMKGVERKGSLDQRPPLSRSSVLKPVELPGRSAANNSSRRAVSTIQSVKVLIQAAGREGIATRDALHHICSIAMLCEACSQGEEFDTLSLTPPMQALALLAVSNLSPHIIFVMNCPSA